METFLIMNNSIKQNKTIMERTKDIEEYKNFFFQISLEADKLIENNDYNPIQFYGIILCYLNFYDYDFFLKLFNKLFKEQCETLYEILLIYSSHFFNSISQNIDFFVKFINYAILKKEFVIFENALNFICYIETFIILIEKFKEQIVDKYVTCSDSFKSIILKSNLRLI